MVHFLVKLFDNLFKVLHLVVILFAYRGRSLVLLQDELELVSAADISLQKFINFLNNRIVAINLRDWPLHESDDHLAHSRLESDKVQIRHRLRDFPDKRMWQDFINLDLLLLCKFAQKHISLSSNFRQSATRLNCSSSL